MPIPEDYYSVLRGNAYEIAQQFGVDIEQTEGGLRAAFDAGIATVCVLIDALIDNGVLTQA